MEEWKEYKLGEVVRLINGRAYSQHELFDDGKYRIVRVGNLSGGDRWFYSNMELSDEKYCEKGDLLYAWACNFGPYIWKGEKTIYHYHIWKLVEDEDVVDKLFLFHYLKYLTPYWLGNVNGSVMVHITKGTMEKFPITLPSLRTQRRIASILSSLDDKIEVNRRINDNLEQQAQALFKSWFVDFEPFRDQPFVESELGMIPKSWRVVSLGDLMSYNGGSQPPASEFVEDYKDGYVRFIQIRDYASDGHITYIPISKRNKLCDIRDIMIARYGASLGRICYGLRGAYNVALAKVTPIQPYYLEFLRCYLNTREFYEGINNKGNRAVQAGFNQSDIQSFRIAFPNNEDIIQNFENVCSAYFDNRLLLEQESRRLAELRDTLLPRLMSGELSVDGLKGQFAVSPGRCPGSKEHVSNKTAL